MRKKGYTRAESPEKMPVTTVGIEMSRGAAQGERRERLTGGNATADDRGIAGLVVQFIQNMYR